ncbi:MAG: hypothetical protein J5507_00660 [Clostridia bacterium]|nr:hypothetical protein [Clostridia bacterium]
MKILKHYSIVLFISFLLFLIIINIFKPIFKAQELIFPYAITPFDIVTKFPKTWFYIKITYCITFFLNLFLAINSIFKFILIKKSKIKNNQNIETNIDFGNFNLLLGTNSITQNNIYIPEKGLYQNILITGTIGSRENCFLYVSYVKSIT